MTCTKIKRSQRMLIPFFFSILAFENTQRTIIILFCHKKKHQFTKFIGKKKHTHNWLAKYRPNPVISICSLRKMFIFVYFLNFLFLLYLNILNILSFRKKITVSHFVLMVSINPKKKILFPIWTNFFEIKHKSIIVQSYLRKCTKIDCYLMKHAIKITTENKNTQNLEN